MNASYRKLHNVEREQLKTQFCSADNWSDIEVADNFDPSRVNGCHFSGRVLIDENVTLRNIGSLGGYEIRRGACLENIAILKVTQESTFGNGVSVSAVNENGGRAIPIFNDMTAQIAYIYAMYRERSETVSKIKNIISRDYCIPSAIGTIEQGSHIVGCGIIRNVNIGEDATIEGALRLENGTVHSFAGQDTYIGIGVNLREFIVCGNSRIDNGTLAERCFFGNSTQASALTATDSLFFAGSHCDNCEVCSVFAGPYTISHHKSTLLIAGLFSFFNAGSGTNQSNHLLKSGPVHQGIHQRGCKYGSDAYMMLPALDGAFTTVLGRHKNHPDTESFPFSILIEGDGQSWILPASNLAAYGPARDFTKWPQRDKRDSHSRDIINFEECNPYLGERIGDAIALCEEFATKENDVFIYKRARIKSTMLRRGLRLYRSAYDKYLGNILATGAAPDLSGNCCWVDAAGQYIPSVVMSDIMDRIDACALDSIQSITEALNEAHKHYPNYAAGWAHARLADMLGRKPTPQDIAEAVERGAEAGAKLASLAADDLRSEQDASMSVSYGIDSQDESERLADFKNVRNL